ncbi:MAG: hypothetical protein IH616_21065 [Gemmatimonadales bacterium]|nr:hypothetical protein [Gemmatimonadales bacterium]
MTRVIRALGWIALGVAAILALLGLATWPPGGLMFALPFVFLLPAMILGLLGAVLLVFTSGATRGTEPLSPPAAGDSASSSTRAGSFEP